MRGVAENKAMRNVSQACAELLMLCADASDSQAAHRDLPPAHVPGVDDEVAVALQPASQGVRFKAGKMCRPVAVCGRMDLSARQQRAACLPGHAWNAYSTVSRFPLCALLHPL